MEKREDTWKIVLPIAINIAMSVVCFFVTVRLIPKLRDMFIKANLYGVDMNKKSSDKM